MNYDNIKKKDRKSAFFEIENPYTMAREMMAEASGTYGQITPEKKVETEPPGPTAGGAIAALTSGGASGALAAGAMGAKMGSVGRYVGIGVGALLGIASYYLS